MKTTTTLLTVIIVLLNIQYTNAQLFTKTNTVPENSMSLFSATADFNNDQLLDIVSITNDQGLNSHMNFYLNTVHNGFIKTPSGVALPALESWRGQAADLNGDTLIDLLISGNSISSGNATVEIYKNKGNLNFEHNSTSTPLSKIHQLELADLNNDGNKELVVSGLSKLQHDTLIVYTQKQGKLEPLSVVLDGAKGIFALVDINADAMSDLVASIILNGKPYNKVFINQGNLIFTASKHSIDSLQLSCIKPIRLDNDSKTDLVFTGKDAAGTYWTKIYSQGAQQTFVQHHSMTSGEGKVLYVADLNHDGKSDLLGAYLHANGTTNLTFIDVAQGWASQKIVEKLIDFQVGDFDNEGNPDLFVLDGSEASFFKNNSERNYPPQVPLKPNVASYNNKVYLGWNSVTDDVSAPDQMTYDMYIAQDQGNLIYSPESSIPSGYRKVFKTGSLGYTTNHVLKGLAMGQYVVAIQAIDNALLSNLSCHGQGSGSGQFLRGFSPETKVLICGQITTKHIQACEGTRLALQATGKEASSWYSVNQGFFNTANTLSYTVGNRSDTIVSSSTETCDNSILYVVVPKTDKVNTNFTEISACPHSLITLHSPIKGVGTQWHSRLQDKIYHTDILKYNSGTKSDSIYVSSSQNLCTDLPIYVIKIIDTVHQPLVTTLCFGKPLEISPQENWTDVVWYNSQGKALNTISEPTLSYYPTSMSDNFIVQKGLYKTCATIDTIHINLHAQPDAHISVDTPTGFGPTSLLATGGSSYLWSPSAGLSAVDVPNPFASPMESTTYTVVVSNSFGCADTAQITLSLKGDVFIPNLFSPNGDGNNDLFKLHGHNISALLFKIYDRSGTVIFETDSLSKTWDGKHNGNIVDSGTYTWTISGSFANGSPINFQGASAGNITLIY